MDSTQCRLVSCHRAGAIGFHLQAPGFVYVSMALVCSSSDVYFRPGTYLHRAVLRPMTVDAAALDSATAELPAPPGPW